MAGSPRVQLSLKGRLLSEVAFAGPQLRIGRMRENDVVVNNLAVSRFHATLRREGDGFLLDDLGSENGTQLNGERISGTVAMKASDVIQLGKYELRIAVQPGLQIAGPPKAKANDAWDSSQTFLALAPPPAGAKQPIVAVGKPPELDAPAALLPDPPAAISAPDPDGVFAFGEDDLAADAIEPLRVSELETDPLSAVNPEHTSLFDFGGPAGREIAPPETQEAEAPSFAAASPDASDAPSELHAGLIVQRDGKLHLLRPWEGGELCAGRAQECEIVLADAGVSRRHVLFSRTPEGYVVRDLESVNGIYVNGQRTKQHVLSVGDVVRVESFELTFVLDHQPIGSEVSAPAQAAPRAHDVGRATQFSLEAPARESEAAFELAPLAGDPADAPLRDNDAPFEANTDGFEILSPADDPIADASPVPATRRDAALPEADLMAIDGDEDEEKEATVHGSFEAAALAAAAPRTPRGAVQLRLRVDSAQLSPRAREALAVLAEEGGSLAALISFEDDGER